MALFTITGDELHDALANVLPHTDKGPGALPVLGAVEVTVADDGLVTFAATDRYTLAVAEVASDPQAALEPGVFLVPRDIAATIVKLAKAGKRSDVTVEADDYTVTARSIMGNAAGGPLELGQFPKWRSLWPDGDPVDIPRIGLGATHLAKFAKVHTNGAPVKRPTLDCTFRGANKPVVVDVVEVDGFRALVMTVRLVGVDA